MMEMSRSVTLLVLSAILLIAVDAAPAAHERVRIINGSNARAGDNPWQVSIQVEYNSISGRKYLHICGGSIINSKWILTAAHCFNYLSGMTIRVDAGDFNFNVTEGTEEYKRIRKIILHDNYARGSYDNDIALIKLSRSLSISDSVSPISLPGSDQQVQGNCTVTGWGITNANGQYPYSFPANLMKVQLPIIDTETCQDKYGDQFKDGMICAGQSNGGSGTCKFDSGGPLTCTNDSGQRYLAGVVSFGRIPCAQANYPSVFSSVPYYRSWISDTIANN